MYHFRLTSSDGRKLGQFQSAERAESFRQDMHQRDPGSHWQVEFVW